MATTVRTGHCGSRLALLIGMVTLSAALAGCVQSRISNSLQVEPLEEVAAKADPLVLSGAAYAPGDLATPPVQEARSPVSTSPIVAAAPVAPASKPVVEVAPVPSQSPVVFAVPATETPSSPLTEDGYPNINIPPAEPTRELLSVEERDKLISDLNALAKRHGSQ